MKQTCCCHEKALVTTNFRILEFRASVEGKDMLGLVDESYVHKEMLNAPIGNSILILWNKTRFISGFYEGESKWKKQRVGFNRSNGHCTYLKHYLHAHQDAV